MQNFLNYQKGYVLKNKNQSVGVSEYHGNRLHHYIVAFKSPILARKVHYTIDPEPVLRIERQGRINIKNEINTCLEELGISGVDNEIYIDVISKLYIPKTKNPGGFNDPMNDGGLHMEEGPLEDYYMMPFDKNIGVILPYELFLEDSKNLVFLCQVIDPVDSYKFFRKSMKWPQ